MPQKKNTKKQASTKKTSKKQASKTTPKVSPIHSFLPWVFGIAAVFLSVCLFFTEYSGIVGKALHTFLLGTLSGAGYAVPVILIIMAFFWKKDAEQNYIKFRITFALTVLFSIAAIIHSIGTLTNVFSPAELWKEGISLHGGGVIGGLIGSALCAAIGKPGLLIVSISLLLLFGIFLLGFTPHSIAVYISYYFHEKKEERKERQKQKALYTDKPEAYIPDDYEEYEEENDVSQETNTKSKNVDIPIEDVPAVNPEIFERIKSEINGSSNEETQDSETIPAYETKKGQKKFPDEEGEVDLAAVFGEEQTSFDSDSSDEPAELSVERKDISETSQKEEKEISKPEKPKYIFPPITLLNIDNKPKNQDVTEELRTNATKLVDTLASFKVRTKIVNISRGPTITRYELAPEEGVRVRQIANLVDDISLSLASSGIRIEAPIPGKAAVGIEVPNKTVATVYLRELIENPSFKNSKSRITVSLGMDVAGAPIFVDIAKMPHLLIAGATGMGKSVCINSMIVSLLYKASPEEVKLILIDPKKVELNIYNSLPHLLVPVVSDPKKAAGSLHWAVTEMERRFELIESVGVRDIYNYNMMTKDDPTYEFMPHVVIIIDELADLMMTAPDEVEESICRLAQKARAAGMHLIIGTQRPSVDVITGLIKANIPSRIAFTVASQVDSRTIIDISGAEKLIGRGDMLYAPVGASKPIRVQGAFVSEQEVEAITGYIKAKTGETEYDNEVIDKIEKEAAKCGVKKGSGAAFADANGDEDQDPMLKPAIELAVESGKISTSLIQRRLSLGYGRAAKLIDKMEQMGIVGAPEGNKPREVLMTKTEFMEMIVASGDGE